MTEGPSSAETGPDPTEIEATANTEAKVLGEFSDESGTGVLGKNTADSGTPIGVEGTVPNASGGYGLFTSDDARVGGTAELAALAGNLTGGATIDDLLGDGLTVDGSALSAAPARPEVTDRSTSVGNASSMTFGDGFTVTEDGDGTATVELDTRWRNGPKLAPEDLDRTDYFGRSIAVSDDGGIVVVSAPGDENTDGDEAGSVSVFRDLGQCIEVAELVQSDGDSDGDDFGHSVALSGDGTVALVGAPADEEPNGSYAGSAYVFDGSDGWADVTTEVVKLTPTDGDSGDSFGYSVGLSDDGTTAIVGAFADAEPNGTNAGSAYVFDGAGGWESVTSEVTKLTASDGDSEDWFGYAVAVDDAGETAVIGAPRDEDPHGTNAGAAYVFDGSGGWSNATETTKLTASDGDAEDRFGESVEIDGAGETAAIAATFDEDPNGSDAGSVYVFEGAGGWEGVTGETTKLAPTDGGSGEYFGRAIDLNDDGSIVLVGTPSDDDPNGMYSGSAYVFDGSSGWNGVTDETTKLVASDGESDDSFGASVALDADASTGFVGAPGDDASGDRAAGSAYVFDGTDGWANTSETTTLWSGEDDDVGDEFGVSVALSEDGTTALIGAQNDVNGTDTHSGAAYVFEYDTEWRQVTKLTSSSGEYLDRFGTSVALDRDGTIALVGAVTDDPGVGGAGAAYVFDGSSGWSNVTDETAMLTASDGTNFGKLGQSVALSDDGTTALVGADGDETPNGDDAGSAYVFDGSGGWSDTTETTKLYASDGDDNDSFGTVVALDGDGTLALVGAATDEDPNGSNAGSAYVFDGSDGWATTTTEMAKLTASDGTANEWFGESAALSDDGSVGVVGAPSVEISNRAGAGAIYVFERDGDWSAVTSETVRLLPTDPDSGAEFGRSVSVTDDGRTVLVGAYGDMIDDQRAVGSAHVFDGSVGWSNVTDPSATLSATDGDGFDYFGVSVALSGDGSTALAGAHFEENPNGPQAGAAYAFYQTL